MKIKKLTTLAMLTAAALIIFVIEAQIPPLTPIPGIKMGLSNIITLVALRIYGKKEAFAVMLMRIILGSFFTGTMTGMIYSLSGGILCFIVMSAIINKFDNNILWAVSVIGAVFHNLGQLSAAVFITHTAEILWYAPILIISGIITGAFTGTAAGLTISKLKNGEEKK